MEEEEKQELIALAEQIEGYIKQNILVDRAIVHGYDLMNQLAAMREDRARPSDKPDLCKIRLAIGTATQVLVQLSMSTGGDIKSKDDIQPHYGTWNFAVQLELNELELMEKARKQVLAKRKAN